MVRTAPAPGGTRRSAAGASRSPIPPMPRHARMVMLILHVALSVGWLGVVAAIITFGTAGLVSDDPEQIRAVYLGAALLSSAVLVPVCLASLLTGLLVSLGGPYGLLRHWWAVVKFVLNLVATTGTIVLLDGRAQGAADHVEALAIRDLPAAPVADIQIQLLVGSCVVFAVLSLATILSVLKPWGRTPWRWI